MSFDPYNDLYINEHDQRTIEERMKILYMKDMLIFNLMNISI